MSNRTGLLVCISLGLVAGFFLLREHWAHALGFAPYLLLLACPLLHLFHGYGGHGRGSGSNSPQPGETK